LLLREKPLVASLHLLPLHLHQEVFQLFEIGLEMEGEVIESLEIAPMYVLEQLVKERSFFEVLEVIERGRITLAFPLIVDPGKQMGKAVIIRHPILVIKLYRL
jgi:hypothetical protein